MQLNGHFLPDSYVLDSFISGLKGAVKPFVIAFNPKTIAEAVKYARVQEEAVNHSVSNNKTHKQPN